MMECGTWAQVCVTPGLLLSPRVVLPDSPQGFIDPEGDMDRKSHCETKTPISPPSMEVVVTFVAGHSWMGPPCTHGLNFMLSTQILSLSAKEWQTHKNWYRKARLSSWASLIVILDSVSIPSLVTHSVSGVTPLGKVVSAASSLHCLRLLSSFLS